VQVNRNSRVLVCQVCERTLLLGERATPFHVGGRTLTVCDLCTDVADQRGWRREGAPLPPPVAGPPERGPGLVARLRGALHGRRPPGGEPALSDEVRDAAPITPQGAALEGVEAFNESQYRRTISGISKSLGEPRVSVVPLPGTRPDVVVTVAWDLSWYQYRVDASGGVIRLENRGDDPHDLDERWQRWNARLAEDGRLAIAV
jgi:hypothetical protein